MIYANGNFYEGEWNNGIIHGQGKMTYAKGDVYEGEWKDGKRHGQGKYTFGKGKWEGDVMKESGKTASTTDKGK